MMHPLERLECIAVGLDNMARDLAAIKPLAGVGAESMMEEIRENVKAYRRAAEIIRHQIECEE
jgi:hypothetical protein